MHNPNTTLPPHREAQSVSDDAFFLEQHAPEQHLRRTDEVVRLAAVIPGADELNNPSVTVPRLVFEDLVKLVELHAANLDSSRVSWGEVKHVAAALRAGLSKVGKIDKPPYASFQRSPDAREAAQRVLSLLDRGHAVSISRDLR